ncbi:MAG TPA: NUDIX hydrolase [Dehalococcoidia bacterium]|jgi:8-oxo-dGTP pyrophosphatase MutT (NUDIX family)|nr:NUDIX hydrolase [Dehalococcoidia bacterium]
MDVELTEIAAGGVVLRRLADQVEVVLCHRFRAYGSEDLYALPKGRLEAEESVTSAALREVREETGLIVEIDRPLMNIEYSVKRTSHPLKYKTVHFFLMRHLGGSFSGHDTEFDEVDWFQVDEAVKLLTYQNQREVLDMALAVIDSRYRLRTD